MTNQDNILEWMDLVESIVDNQFKSYEVEDHSELISKSVSINKNKSEIEINLLSSKENLCILSQKESKKRASKEDFQHIIDILKIIVPSQRRLYKKFKNLESDQVNSLKEAIGKSSSHGIWIFKDDPYSLKLILETNIPSINFNVVKYEEKFCLAA